MTSSNNNDINDQFTLVIYSKTKKSGGSSSSSSISSSTKKSGSSSIDWKTRQEADKSEGSSSSSSISSFSKKSGGGSISQSSSINWKKRREDNKAHKIYCKSRDEAENQVLQACLPDASLETVNTCLMHVLGQWSVEAVAFPLPPNEKDMEVSENAFSTRRFLYSKEFQKRIDASYKHAFEAMCIKNTLKIKCYTADRNTGPKKQKYFIIRISGVADPCARRSLLTQAKPALLIETVEESPVAIAAAAENAVVKKLETPAAGEIVSTGDAAPQEMGKRKRIRRVKRKGKQFAEDMFDHAGIRITLLPEGGFVITDIALAGTGAA